MDLGRGSDIDVIYQGRLTAFSHSKNMKFSQSSLFLLQLIVFTALYPSISGHKKITTVWGLKLPGDFGFQSIDGISVLGSGKILVADSTGHSIQGLDLHQPYGIGTLAGFNQPSDIVYDGSGNCFVANTLNHKIRKVNITTGSVTTIAGSGIAQHVNGLGLIASFNASNSICIQKQTESTIYIFVSDTNNHYIRRIKLGSYIVVTDFAGTGIQGYQNGASTSAMFSYPAGITSTQQDVYIADRYNHVIRKVSSNTGVVSTLAGSGIGGYSDSTIGTLAQFKFPSDVALDSAGNLYVTNSANNMIRMVTMQGKVTTIAGSGRVGFYNNIKTLSTFSNPIRVAIYKGVAYVSDSNNIVIRKILSCSTGYVANITTSTCDICPPGKFSNGSMTHCGTCPENAYTPSTTSTTGGGAEYCLPCPLATYSYRGASTYCATGFYNPVDSSDCYICEYGTPPGAAAAACCDPDTSLPVSSLIASAALLAASHWVVHRHTSSVCCAAGSYAPFGSTSCQYCYNGTYSAPGAYLCTKCPLSTNSYDGAAVCCGGGSYAPRGFPSSPPSSSCFLCPAGTFSEPGASSCAPCPSGTWSYVGASICCAGGSSAPSGSTSCSTCTAGTYAHARATHCAACDTGTWSYVGASVCCASGSFAATGDAVCTTCPVDTYSAAGAYSCMRCSSGTSSSSTFGASVCCSIAIQIFLVFNPLLVLLRYLMPFVTISSFIGAGGVHTSSPTCDLVQGLEGMDTVIAGLSTLLACSIIMPGLFTMSVIIHPGVPKSLNKQQQQQQQLGLLFLLPRSNIIDYKKKHIFYIFSIDLWLLRSIHQWAIGLHNRVVINGSREELDTETYTIDKIVLSDGKDHDKYESDSTMSGDGHIELPYYWHFATQMKLVKDDHTNKPIDSNNNTSSNNKSNTNKNNNNNPNNNNNHDNNIPMMYMLLALTPLGQLCTPTDRYGWYTAIWKYFSFAKVCLGIWSDSSADNFRVQEKVHEFIPDPQMRSENMPLFMASMTSSAPMLTFSKSMNDVLPNMIASSAYELAREEDKDCNWKNVLKTLSIFIQQSHLSVIVLLILVVITLDSSSRTLDFLVYLGDVLGVEDIDFIPWRTQQTA
eukprot:gene6838-13850_t